MMYLTELRPLTTQWTPQETQEINTFEPAINTFQPAISFRELPEAFEIRTEIPGIDPQTIDLTMANGELTIRGERPEIDSMHGEIWHHNDLCAGPFERTFAFPATVATDAVAAESRFGVLTIMVAKSPDAISRTIPITISQ